ncbi:xylulose kinase [bacterium SM23_57]|nr:MAG: xylulose kinase [bacterium SM23_57]
MSTSKNQEKYILAIDHGTSAMKPAIVSTHGKFIGWSCENTPLHLQPGGGAEQNPDEWWNAFLKATKNLIDQRLVPTEDIIAVCNTSQWSGTVAIDENGLPLMNSVIWMDSRGAPYVKKKFKGIINIQGYSMLNLLRWLRKTAGIPMQSGKDPIAHILYIKHELPDIYEQARWFLEPTDYINFKLSGEIASSPSTMMLHWVSNTRNINNVHYDDGLIKRLGIHKDKLPAMKQSIDVLGTLEKEVANAIGLQEDLKVFVSTSDVPSAIIGSGAVQDYAGHVYIGTSSWLTCHVPYKKTDINTNIASLPSAIPGRYFIANEQETAGACLNFLRDQIFYPDDEAKCGNQAVYQEFDQIVEKITPGSHNIIFTPWLYGERTPVEDHTVRGAFFNLSLDSEKGDMIRAVFEGVAYNSRWVLNAVEKFIKQPLPSLNMIGGGAQSNIWCQIYADVLNREIRQVINPIQANARGAAFIASVGLGHITFDEIPNLIQISKVFKPNTEYRKLYDTLFKEYLSIYKTNKDFYRRLNT